MDIPHLEWMIPVAEEVCKKENIDDSLLLPLVILHDVGYAECPKDNSFGLDMRKAHMKAGEKIAKQLLEKINYPKEKIEKISYYISVHDNWAFGEQNMYWQDKILGTFGDLDFIWVVTPKGFVHIKSLLNKNDKELIEYAERKSDSNVEAHFITKTTKKLFEKYLKERKAEQ